MKLMVKTKVNLNLDVINQLDGQAKNIALEKTANWILSEIIASKQVPMLTGDLQRSGFIKVISDNFDFAHICLPYYYIL